MNRAKDVLLVHAFPFDAHLFDPQRARLGDRLHTPDLPGFGDAVDEAPAHSIDAMADAVHAWAHARGLTNFVLGGVSMGGYVALAYVRRYGTRDLAGLVLADTRADADSTETKANRDAQLRLLDSGSTHAVVERLLPRLLAPSAPAWLVDEVRGRMRRQPVGTVAAALKALRDRPDASPLLPTLDLPVLVICGAEDAVSPPSLMRPLAAAIPNARYVELPGAGHLANLESPDAFTAALSAFV